MISLVKLILIITNSIKVIIITQLPAGDFFVLCPDASVFAGVDFLLEVSQLLDVGEGASARCTL